MIEKLIKSQMWGKEISTGIHLHL